MNDEEKDDDDVYSYIKKGETLLNDNKYDDALVSLNKVIECSQFESLLNTVKSEAYFNKGFALWKLNRNSEAIKCFDKAIETNSMNSFTYLFKSFSLANLARYSEAQEFFDKATKYNAKIFNLLAYSNEPIQYFFLIQLSFIVFFLIYFLLQLLPFHYFIFLEPKFKLFKYFSTISILIFMFMCYICICCIITSEIFNFFSWFYWMPFIKSILYKTIKESLEKESAHSIFLTISICLLLILLYICYFIFFNNNNFYLLG
jgi:tetratricopeptide (TPR) repeat protein